VQQLEVLHNDDNYIAVNKPSGMLSIPHRFEPEQASVLQILRAKFTDVYTVHRIDKDTSGCIIFAKNAESHQYLNTLFEKRQVHKEYTALVHGNLMYDKGTIHNKLTEHPTIKGKMMVHAKLGKDAITDYIVLEAYKGFSVIGFTIHTGRMHQIRVHSANLGHPIVCDPLYGQEAPLYVSAIKGKKFSLGKWVEEEQPILNRLALHSSLLSFMDADGQTITCTAPLFKDMRASIQQLKKWAK
jgi:23S rRNA pseudouridine1911/1915/1917 synthase